MAKMTQIYDNIYSFVFLNNKISYITKGVNVEFGDEDVIRKNFLDEAEIVSTYRKLGDNLAIIFYPKNKKLEQKIEYELNYGKGDILQKIKNITNSSELNLGKKQTYFIHEIPQQKKKGKSIYDVLFEQFNTEETNEMQEIKKIMKKDPEEGILHLAAKMQKDGTLKQLVEEEGMPLDINLLKRAAKWYVMEMLVD